jgi:hypothetical protein
LHYFPSFSSFLCALKIATQTSAHSSQILMPFGPIIKKRDSLGGLPQNEQQRSAVARMSTGRFAPGADSVLSLFRFMGSILLYERMKRKIRWKRKPVTAGTRAAYSPAYTQAQERRETVVIELRAAQGTDAEIVSASPQTNIRLVRSGGNAK